MDDRLILGGVIALIVATAMRVLAQTRELGWLYSLFYFGLVTAVFVGCFGATSGEATAMALAAVLSMHFINHLRLGAQQRQAQEQELERERERQRQRQQPPVQRPKSQTKQRPPVQDAPPVRQKPPVQDAPPVREPPKEQKKSTKVKPVVHDPQAAEKKPAEKQTLKLCLRCGKRIQSVRCGYCGFDVTRGNARLLCRVDPRRLKIPKQ